MFAKVLSISDTLMWRWYTLLSFKSMAEIEALKKEVEGGRNPKDAKVMLAKEITARFHSAAAADAAEQDFINRSKGGVPDEIPEVSLSGAPLGIGGAAERGGPGGVQRRGQPPDRWRRCAHRLVAVVSDKGLKLGAGVYVVQVGKRKFARVTLVLIFHTCLCAGSGRQRALFRSCPPDRLRRSSSFTSLHTICGCVGTPRISCRLEGVGWPAQRSKGGGAAQRPRGT
jgi:hypothetical protein